MYMAIIKGWSPVVAFGDTEEQAQKLALKRKKKLCKDDLVRWTWENAKEYYGGWSTEITSGTVFDEYNGI